MLALSMGLYIIALVFIWGFFIVAKVHFYKFKEYSAYVIPTTKILLVVLTVLSLLGFYYVYKISGTGPTTKTVEEAAINEVY